jgi:uncharacterized membrane protein YhaH (DUF805 family)
LSLGKSRAHLPIPQVEVNEELVTFANLWRWDGKVTRKTYAIVGTVGFALKRVIDLLVATQFLGHGDKQTFAINLTFFNYWLPLGRGARLSQLSDSEMRFLATMLLIAMPFIWIGLAMTVRRLRDAGQPIWLAVFFFIPLLNVLFFLMLCLLPPRERPQTAEAAPWPQVRPLDGIIPRSELGSAVLSIVLTTAIGLLCVLWGTKMIGAYGWSLFVALPFCLGLFSVLLYSYHAPRSLWTCFNVSLLPIGILGVVLIAVAIEGLICILMAAPLALGLAALGGALGYFIQSNYWSAKNSAVMFSMVLLVTPASFGIERAVHLQPPTFAVRTSIDIDAPPEQVWQQVVAFAQIPPPQEMLFRAGVAYPIRAEINGRGVGAVRHCIFSTGAFVEPIEVWNEPHLLRFTVTSSPSPLNELTPYGQIEPRHLHGYFVSEEGQFLLTPLPGGGTRLEGTTWYRNAMWPAAYWHIWSDYIIHRIHLRVLTHIREAAMNSRARGGS